MIAYMVKIRKTNLYIIKWPKITGRAKWDA